MRTPPSAGAIRRSACTWFASATTAGTPPAIVTRLNGIINKALKDPALAEKLMVQGIVPKTMTPAEYKAFVDSETAKFGKVVATADIKLAN
jgi:tripartite-type tricarboxylate transporter receptor subunit TctC